VTAGEILPDISACRELASALRAGDDPAAGLAARAGIPQWLLTLGIPAGPRRTVT